MGAGATKEIFAVCQPEEVSISSERGLVPWLFSVLEKDPHERQKN